MRKRFFLALLVACLLHLTLWFASEQYRYDSYAPTFLIDFVAKFLDYQQIEDLPEAKAGAVFIAGLVLWVGIAAALGFVMKPDINDDRSSR